ncbi:hypothetical protein LC087_05855 [Bacillus carboniphilus]|uniref:DUF3021 domain-containing protein n=1 Tax=Bacillus carboniphilus TaxID=86663 RepID=A0ABY9JYP6_9BACI|nr:hypothetical protein [Bacillus carboniphilus]WLR43667.1 hypothetical protein LC087_05855 [Bacillus carboniphilus]
MKKVYYYGAISGLVSGILMGMFLKVLEEKTGEKVYTLLLNIDFIYENPLPELVEFSLHLLVAIGIGVLLQIIVSMTDKSSFNSILIYSFLLTAPTIILFFPLTTIANKPTPEMSDVLALSLWTVGHIIFAFILGLLLHCLYKRNQP